MRSLNRVMLMGHLAADVELRQTKNGACVASFPIAINRWTKGEDGEKNEVADFHRIVVWGKLAEVCAQYLGKGVAVHIEGRLMNRSYEDKEGNRHFKTEVVADDVNFLTWKRSKSGKDFGLEPVNKDEDKVDVEEKEAIAV